MSPLALQGLRVLEVGEGTGVAFCGKLFAGLGAEVTKIEAPAGDALRYAGPFPDGTPNPDVSAAYLNLNTAKQGVTLDLQSASGVGIFAHLAAEADVIIEGFAPGHLDSLGLGYERLSESNAGLVLVSITPFGQDGPYRDYLANELVVYAASGYMSLAGDPDREPHKAYGEQTAIHAGYQGALAAIAAITARDASGVGQWIDVAQAEAAAFLSGGGSPAAYILRGEIAKRSGARLNGQQAHSNYPSTFRPCADGGWIHAHGNFRYPQLMGEVMDPRLNDPEILKTPHGHADEIDAIMDEWLAQYDKWEVVRRAQAARLHFTEVMTPAEVLSDGAYVERDFWFTYHHPEAGDVMQPGPMVRMSATPWTNAPAPSLGEHNAAVLAHLGFSPDEILVLAEHRVI